MIHCGGAPPLLVSVVTAATKGRAGTNEGKVKGGERPPSLAEVYRYRALRFVSQAKLCATGGDAREIHFLDSARTSAARRRTRLKISLRLAPRLAYLLLR